MARMVRKQVYIEDRQDALLKRQARTRKTSQAELIREAIDRQVVGGSTGLVQDPAAWQAALQFMHELAARRPVVPQARTWKRDDLYEERLSRYDAGTH